MDPGPASRTEADLSIDKSELRNSS